MLLSIAACQPRYPVITQEFGEKLLDDFVQSRAVLDCGINCSWSWITAQPELRRLHDIEDWRTLALRVLQIGAQKDLGYYYLGRAAEGLGAYVAAIRYYRISGAIAQGTDRTLQCRMNETCAGFVLPRDAMGRMNIIFAAVRAPPPPATVRPPRALRPGTVRNAPSPASPLPEAGWIDPPPVVR